MPRMQRPYHKTITATVASDGTCSVSFDHNSIGFPPYLIGSFNVVATGLGSGTFQISGVCYDEVTRPLHPDSFGDTSIVYFQDAFILNGIVLDVTGASSGDEVNITLVAFGRDYRFELGV